MSSLVGSLVRIESSVTLYRDSDGNGPGKKVSGTFTCNRYLPKKTAPIHICNENGDLGWIKCKPTGRETLSNPPQRILEPMEVCL